MFNLSANDVPFSAKDYALLPRPRVRSGAGYDFANREIASLCQQQQQDASEQQEELPVAEDKPKIDGDENVKIEIGLDVATNNPEMGLEFGQEFQMQRDDRDMLSSSQTNVQPRLVVGVQKNPNAPIDEAFEVIDVDAIE